MDTLSETTKLNQPLSPTGSRKRPAPSLLPAFEPSSQGLTRPSKKQARTVFPQRNFNRHKYPTPIPSSTTGILSSPPQISSSSCANYSQPPNSQRVPLSNIPSVTIPEDGGVLKFGRSSISSNYQLSANRLISRVHAEAQYIAATAPLEPNRIQIKCTGWNGLKIHSSARTWELEKGDFFTSETEFAEIILDIQDNRLLIEWPNNDRDSQWAVQNISSRDDSPSARRFHAFSPSGDITPSSLFQRIKRIESPVSPSPAGKGLPQHQNSSALTFDEPDEIQIYEDKSPVDESPTTDKSHLKTHVNTSTPAVSPSDLKICYADSDISDEENNPVINSFDRFKANTQFMITPSSDSSPGLNTTSPTSAKPAHPPTITLETYNSNENRDILNYVLDQLAFSLKSSTPPSDLFEHLPATFKQESRDAPHEDIMNPEKLRILLKSSKGVGEITREGKDAAGKFLESHYYYIPEEDTEEGRRAVVQNLQKPSLRNCRKQHKQYYWKKPKTP